MNLHAHAQMLANIHGCRVVRVKDLGDAAVADTSQRIVTIPPACTNVEYYACLHEIAHVVLGHRRYESTTQIVKVKQETEAWLWALDHGKAPITEAVKADVARCLYSYVQHLDNEKVLIGTDTHGLLYHGTHPTKATLPGPAGEDSVNADDLNRIKEKILTQRPKFYDPLPPMVCGDDINLARRCLEQRRRVLVSPRVGRILEAEQRDA